MIEDLKTSYNDLYAKCWIMIETPSKWSFFYDEKNRILKSLIDLFEIYKKDIIEVEQNKTSLARKTRSNLARHFKIFWEKHHSLEENDEIR